MANSCTMDDYAKKIPSLDKLVQEYHLSADVAFFLWRPIFAHKIGVSYDLFFEIIIWIQYTLYIWTSRMVNSIYYYLDQV